MKNVYILIQLHGLILFFIVFPENIYLVPSYGTAMNTSPEISWGRLPFQAELIALAYWHTKS